MGPRNQQYPQNGLNKKNIKQKLDFAQNVKILQLNICGFRELPSGCTFLHENIPRGSLSWFSMIGIQQRH